MGTVLLFLGLLLLWIGSLGMLRFRSPYCRLQVAGVGDIGGAAVFLVGLLLHSGWEATGGIMIVLLLFLIFTNPLGTHAIAKSAFVRRVRD
jgi:multicomponent Na+:H+ antiporter subunit G